MLPLPSPEGTTLWSVTQVPSLRDLGRDCVSLPISAQQMGMWVADIPCEVTRFA
jgi:hypothetical protein